MLTIMRPKWAKGKDTLTSRTRKKLKSTLTCVELESRLVPNTYYVTDAGDSGPGTLRDVIETSQSEGTLLDDIIIDLDPFAVIELESELPAFFGGSISTIEPVEITRESENNFRLLYINTSASISGITFTNGYGAGGGAIFALNQLVIDDCVFDSNYSSGNGGAINCGWADINHCVFSGNAAYDNGGAMYIFSQGAQSTLIDNSSFPSNSVENGNGGAIYIVTTGYFIVDMSDYDDPLEIPLGEETFGVNMAVNGYGGDIYVQYALTTIGELVSSGTGDIGTAKDGMSIYASYMYSFTVLGFFADRDSSDPYAVNPATITVTTIPGGSAFFGENVTCTKKLNGFYVY